MRDLTRSTVLVTGGAGFIGSAVIRQLLASGVSRVVNLDKLTYAGNLDSLADVAGDGRYAFAQVDVADPKAVRRALREHRPDGILHLAAESHVDRSIDGPAAFIGTNLLGTYTLLNEAVEYLREAPEAARRLFRFVHVSTDEVFGSLGADGRFTHATPYKPSSPYSATKAGSDHLVRAWYQTYGLPTIVSNCSNNYGPYQFPEKLIPLMILKALEGAPMPVYGDGQHVRDWLYVDDHARALVATLERGRAGQTYLVGGGNERRNLDVVTTICDLLDELRPAHRARRDLITFVPDRPGHDRRYAIDASVTERELGWTPTETFESGLRKTVRWYVEHEAWWRRVLSGAYRGQRLGVASI